MTMDELKPKQSAYIRSVGGVGALRHHLLDMGLTPKTEVTLQKIAPMGDPVQIELRGYELTLRLDEAQKIKVEKVRNFSLAMQLMELGIPVVPISAAKNEGIEGLIFVR